MVESLSLLVSGNGTYKGPVAGSLAYVRSCMQKDVWEEGALQGW